MHYQDIILTDRDGAGLSETELRGAAAAIAEACEGRGRILALPPDHTRLHSGAGMLTALLYNLLGDRMDIMPALGTHEPLTDAEINMFFGSDIPKERFLVHDWKNAVVTIGEVPRDYVREVSEGLMDEPIDIAVNRALVSGEYGLVISIGQVVPHEVAGMANYTKNILVGVGGCDLINKSHYLGAVYGMERILGRTDTPVRRIFDYAEEHLLAGIPLLYVLTVTTKAEDGVRIHGLFAGRSRSLFEEAARLSRRRNMNFLEKPIGKCVVYLDPAEFKSTWLGNKAVYRTRMAMADGGELVILAPGLSKFGEDRENDRLIRKYGYAGREGTIRLVEENEDLRQNRSVAAQIIHGSSEGRFTVTYCTACLSREEVEGVGFGYMPYERAAALYDIRKLKNGWNTLESGEEIFFIDNPALGLWSLPMDD